MQSTDGARSIHPINDLVMAVIQDGDMVGLFNSEEFDKWKLTRQLTPHSNRNYFVIRPVKDRNPRVRVTLLCFRQVRAIVVTLAQQPRDPSSEDRRRFFTQGRERRDQYDALDVMARRK